MKTVLLALSLLTGDQGWQGKIEEFAGITCASIQDVQRISAVRVGYSLNDTIDRANCLFMSFEGTKVSELPEFGVGDTLYHFLIVSFDGYTVYVLEETGEGYLV